MVDNLEPAMRAAISQALREAPECPCEDCAPVRVSMILSAVRPKILGLAQTASIAMDDADRLRGHAAAADRAIRRQGRSIRMSSDLAEKYVMLREGRGEES